jgi:co-chaperonin GroES (HSP10)
MTTAIRAAVRGGAQTIAEAFPTVDPNAEACGDKVIVQMRRPKRMTAGGLILPDDSRDTEKWNQQVGRVVAVGPLAFRNRETMQPWPEGAWYGPGDFVRVPKYGGDRWEVNGPDGGDDKILMIVFRDAEIFAKVNYSSVHSPSDSFTRSLTPTHHKRKM